MLTLIDKPRADNSAAMRLLDAHTKCDSCNEACGGGMVVEGRDGFRHHFCDSEWCMNYDQQHGTDLFIRISRR